MATKALLALNDPTGSSRLSKALSGVGLDLKSCATVGDALKTLATGPIDIVFCQERLPDGSFRDILRYAVSRGKAPVVVCSEFYDKKAYVEAMSVGAFDYITFPYNSRDVEWIVGNALHKAHLSPPDHQHRAAA